MESVSTPRVSAALIPSFVDRNVMVVGQVMQLRGDSAIIDAGGQVNISLTAESHLMAGNGAQIIGKVMPDHSIKVYNAMDLGADIDYNVAQAVVDVTHQYKELFVFENGASFDSGPLTPQQQQTSLSSQLQSHSQSQSQSQYHGAQIPSRPATVPSTYSFTDSDNDTISSSSSFNDELSRLAISVDGPFQSQPSSSLATAPVIHPSRQSSSSPDSLLSSANSLDEELSRLVIDDRRSLPPVSISNDPPPEDPSVPDDLYDFDSDDDTHPSHANRLDHENEHNNIDEIEFSYEHSRQPDYDFDQNHTSSPRSKPSKTSVTQSSPITSSPSVQRNRYTNAATQTTPPRRRDIFSKQPPSPTPPIKQTQRQNTFPSFSPKIISTPKQQPPPTPSGLNPFPSPSPSPSAQYPSPPSTRSPRLFRTRSGNLATAAELRARKREKDLLAVILAGIAGNGNDNLGEGNFFEEADLAEFPFAFQQQSKGKGKGKDKHNGSTPSIAMRVDESGRWRIACIFEPGPKIDDSKV
ncbi:replication factor A protein 3-domain-containing protein [Xylariaceae sp. FL0255]|nr:replication factor A protein 3-domain-containing protein [Xylariaceae sp. FL0255]